MANAEIYVIWKKTATGGFYRNKILKNFAIFTGKHLCEIFKNTILKISAYGCFWTDFIKWLFGTLLLDCILNHLDSVILQTYKSLSNQSFKENFAYMSSIYLTLTLSCEPRFCMFIINGYYTKSKCL